ncbi:hypothetical protein AMJ83_06285 [candidate division WOR_3 bacterium SM23_42]|uniref:Tetratricopeptide repeat protein n=1 Tax=candidate division WOR_3 bacterium SM23_42 TaxID=1703779 RepID=A0A0S8FSD5_UNCW3|nr:MAG: hypothetical protein AMJ83_06285 [candidate division WOR_3 bacterium SM23_42]
MRRSIFIVIILTASFIWADVFTELNTARIAYFNEQDYERARAACLRGIELAAGHFELHVILGGSEMGLANWQAAASAFEKAFEIDTSKTIEWIVNQKEGGMYYFQAFYFSARELFEQAEYAEALNYLNYDQLFDIEDINIHVLKGAILCRLERFEESNNEYMKVLKLAPDDPDVNFLIGKARFDGGDFEGCQAFFSTAIKYYKIKYDRLGRIIFQNMFEVDSLLAQQVVVLWVRGEMEELDRLFKGTLGFHEGLAVQKANVEKFTAAADDLGRAYYYSAVTQYNSGNDTLALEDMILSVRYKPDDLDALYYAGEISVKLKQYDAAVTYLERLTEQSPADKYALFHLGVCYTETGRYSKAIEVYENRILKIDPDNVDVMNNLAYVYREIGDSDKALFWLMRVEEVQKKN